MTVPAGGGDSHTTIEVDGDSIEIIDDHLWFYGDDKTPVATFAHGHWIRWDKKAEPEDDAVLVTCVHHAFNQVPVLLDFAIEALPVDPPVDHDDTNEIVRLVVKAPYRILTTDGTVLADISPDA